MSTWEERMSQRGQSRVEAGIDLESDALAARAAYIQEMGEHVTSPEPPEDPTICRECYAWQPMGNWPGVYVWKLVCDFGRNDGCGHVHHDDEVWLACIEGYVRGEK